MNLHTMQPESILERPENEETPNASKIIIGGQTTSQSPNNLYTGEQISGEFNAATSNYITGTNTNQELLAQSRSNNFKLDLTMSAVQTEHILSHTSPNEHSMIFNGSPH